MMDSERPLVRELYGKMRTQLLRPKTIVDYTREPYIYPAGNVRVTLDYDIRTGLRSTDVALTMITTVVILAVTSNVVLSLGMVGALYIVRNILADMEGVHSAVLVSYNGDYMG